MVRLDERGRANLNAIMAGFGAVYAAQQGWADFVSVTIRAIPSMAVRSAWGFGSAKSMSATDAADTWRELGDGSYLMTIERGDQREHAVVDVVDGVPIDREPIDEDQIDALPALYSVLEGPAAPVTEVLALAVTDGADVGVQHRH